MTASVWSNPTQSAREHLVVPGAIPIARVFEEDGVASVTLASGVVKTPTLDVPRKYKF